MPILVLLIVLTVALSRARHLAIPADHGADAEPDVATAREVGKSVGDTATSRLPGRDSIPRLQRVLP